LGVARIPKKYFFLKFHIFFSYSSSNYLAIAQKNFDLEENLMWGDYSKSIITKIFTIECFGREIEQSKVTIHREKNHGLGCKIMQC